MDKFIVGKRIRDMRKDLGLTQIEFGVLVWPNDPPEITQSRISRYETGFYSTPAYRFLDIQHAYENQIKNR